MSRHNISLDLSKKLEPALPEPEASSPDVAPPQEFARSDLQASFGNALLATAATSDSPPDPTGTLPHQLGYGNAAVARKLIQRKANDNGPTGSSNAASPDATTTAPGADVPATAPTQGLIVEDNAETVQPEQMKKSAFLAQVRSAVNNTVAEVAAGTPTSAAAAPQIESAFAQYSGQSARQLEGNIRRQVPGAAGVTTAAGFIPAIVSLARRSLQESMPSSLTGAASAIGSAVSGAASAVAEGVGSALSSIGGLFRKARNDGARATDHDPEAIQSQLGAGHLLDAGVRSRMESAYGQSFGAVEVHTDANAGGLSENLNARAFTVGQHIAFGAGEYQPGTLIGDALIAHELAHVMQQRGGAATEGVAHKGATEYNSLENDADEAAVGAVVSALGGAKAGLAKIPKRSMPSLKSGLRLQRCYCGSQSASTLLAQQEQAAITHNSGLGYDAATITSIQTLVGASTTGTWDGQTVQKIAVWQTGQGLAADGKVDAATLRAMILALVGASKFDEVIHVIVDAFNFPTTNLGSISYDATVTSADAITSGTIATGASQTVQVGPSTFVATYEHMIRIIGHELQHVQQRTGTTPILNQHVREFLSFSWEALDTSTPALTPADRVLHARIAIGHYNTFSTAEKTTYDATYQRLLTLIANGGVGNP